MSSPIGGGRSTPPLQRLRPEDELQDIDLTPTESESSEITLPTVDETAARAQQASVEAWENILRQANAPVISNRTENRHLPHQYIVINETESPSTNIVELLSVTVSPTASQRKLSLEEIIAWSNAAIQRETYLYNQGVNTDNPIVNRTELNNHVTDIRTLTESLIDARAEKRAHNGTRNFWRTLTGVFSFFAVGLPFYLAIKYGDKKFAREIRELKARILNIQVPTIQPVPLSGMMLGKVYSDIMTTGQTSIKPFDPTQPMS